MKHLEYKKAPSIVCKFRSLNTFIYSFAVKDDDLDQLS